MYCYYLETKDYYYDFDWYMYVKIDMYCVCKTEKMSKIWHSEI